MASALLHIVNCFRLHGIGLLVIAALAYLLTLNTVWRWAPLTTDVFIDLDSGRIAWLHKFHGLASRVTLCDIEANTVVRISPLALAASGRWHYLSSRSSSLDLLVCKAAWRDSAGSPDMKLRSAFWTLRDESQRRAGPGSLSHLSPAALAAALDRALYLLDTEDDMDYPVCYLDHVRRTCLSRQGGEIGAAELPSFAEFRRSGYLLDNHPGDLRSGQVNLQELGGPVMLRRGNFKLTRWR
jgi:hypothetical protein